MGRVDWDAAERGPAGLSWPVTVATAELQFRENQVSVSLEWGGVEWAIGALRSGLEMEGAFPRSLPCCTGG